jgi:hypothetical protein
MDAQNDAMDAAADVKDASDASEAADTGFDAGCTIVRADTSTTNITVPAGRDDTTEPSLAYNPVEWACAPKLDLVTSSAAIPISKGSPQTSAELRFRQTATDVWIAVLITDNTAHAETTIPIYQRDSIELYFGDSVAANGPLVENRDWHLVVDRDGRTDRFVNGQPKPAFPAAADQESRRTTLAADKYAIVVRTKKSLILGKFNVIWNDNKNGSGNQDHYKRWTAGTNTANCNTQVFSSPFCSIGAMGTISFQ